KSFLLARRLRELEDRSYGRRLVPAPDAGADDGHGVPSRLEGGRDLTSVHGRALEPEVRDATVGADVGDSHRAVPRHSRKRRASGVAALRSARRSATNARPASPRRRPRPASTRSARIAPARATASFGATRRPVSPSRTSSGMPEMSVATTGSPEAIASMRT